MISLLKTRKEIEKEKEIQKTKDFIKEYQELCRKHERDIRSVLQIYILPKQEQVIEEAKIIEK